MRVDLTNLNFNLYRLLPLALIFWPAGNAIADYALSPLLTSRSAVPLEGFAISDEPVYLSEGDRVAGLQSIE